MSRLRTGSVTSPLHHARATVVARWPSRIYCASSIGLSLNSSLPIRHRHQLSLPPSVTLVDQTLVVGAPNNIKLSSQSIVQLSSSRILYRQRRLHEQCPHADRRGLAPPSLRPTPRQRIASPPPPSPQLAPIVLREPITSRHHRISPRLRTRFHPKNPKSPRTTRRWTDR